MAGKVALKPRKAAFYATFIVLQVAVILMVVEIAARAFDPLGISYYPATAAYMDTMILEEPIGYRNRPNLEGQYYGVPVKLNSLGLRDREIDAAPKEGEFRVLILGDSVPFGIGVEYQDSIPHQLERLLNLQAARRELEYRTVNMGTISYNTEQELIQLKTQGLGLKPNLVVLMYMANDVQPKMWIFDKRGSWFVRLAERSYAVSLAAVLYKRLTGFGPLGRMEGEYRADSRGWIVADRALTEINRTCRSQDIPFVVITFPPIELVAEVGRREDFPVVSLWEAPYWKRTGEAPADYQNSASDGHPNAAGSRVYAELIYDTLVGLELASPAGPVPDPAP